MRDALLRILDRYLSEKGLPFTDNPLAYFLRHEAPAEIQLKATIPRQPIPSAWWYWPRCLGRDTMDRHIR